MWYKTTINGVPAFMFFDGEHRVCFPVGENPMGWGDRYLAWVAEGNIAEELVSE